MIGHDEAAAGVERHLLEAPQLHRAQVAVEIAVEPGGALFLPVQQALEAFAAREAEAGEALPAVVLGEAQHALAAARIGDRLAEGGGQREAVLLRLEREALSAVSVRPWRHFPRTPSIQLGRPSPRRAACQRGPAAPKWSEQRADCPMDSLSIAGEPGMEGEIRGLGGKSANPLWICDHPFARERARPARMRAQSRAAPLVPRFPRRRARDRQAEGSRVQFLGGGGSSPGPRVTIGLGFGVALTSGATPASAS